MRSHEARDPCRTDLQPTERTCTAGPGQAPDASHAHRAFLACMRYELRLPLNVIISDSFIVTSERGQEECRRSC